ncbi:hypothetical protein TH61_03470 [Rufibacter sp. DG15C]|uniref:Ig-like domain-containing protein n=1 Tax=Rufibacter sp. DG15C TaxID=1379909 RepID=UPI00078C5F18|nr:Ig-like domain-containing protein [Rufibacter sp. DG15C]AMM50432.1 hypothetical protein TH61_03470 [Rufibacter sp. DG15C]
MKHLFNNWRSLLVLVALFSFTACSDDEDDNPTKFELKSLMAGTVDLNTATAATNVPTNAAIKATFSVPVNATSATNTNITLKKQGDTNAVPATVTTSGMEVTLTPSAPLVAGTTYTLSMGALTAADGQTMAAMTKTFTTAGTAPLPGVIAHWSFDGNANDQVGAFSAPASGVVAITYGEDRKGQAGKAAVFNGTTSIIEIPNGEQLLNSSNFTLSFWMKATSAGQVDGSGNPKAHFVMGLGAFHGLAFELGADYNTAKVVARYEWGNGTTSPGDFFFNGDGMTGTSGGWEAIEVEKNLTAAGGMAALVKDKWAHIAVVFNGTAKTRSLYVNGVLMERDNFMLLPSASIERTMKGLKYDANPEVENKFAFGFNQSRGGTLWASEPWGGYNQTTANHFRGSLDEVRIFHTALTDAEVLAMYNAEK